MQGGDQLCQIACETPISIRQQLKAKVEIESGLKAAALAIYLPEVAQPLGQNVTLADCGLPSVLITLTLHKIVIADMLGVSPSQLADAQLAQACSTAGYMRSLYVFQLEPISLYVILGTYRLIGKTLAKRYFHSCRSPHAPPSATPSLWH
jgi:hypothetical protein